MYDVWYNCIYDIWIMICMMCMMYFCVQCRLIKGSLEVKLPTIWTDEKAEVGRVREEKKKEDQRRERVRGKKMQVREQVEKSRNTVFFQQTDRQAGRQTDIHTYGALFWTSFVCTCRFGLPFGVFFFNLAFLLLINLARDDYCIETLHWGVCACWTQLILQPYNSPAHHNHHPHFHPQHPHHPLRPHHRRHQLIPVTITFVIINFLHRYGQQPHQRQKIGTVCNLQPFVTCSNSKKPRETVAAFRLHLAVPRVRLPPYPSPASFRTSLLASSNSRSFSLGWLWSACERDWVLQPNAMMPPGGVYNHVALPWRGCILSMISVPLGFVWALGTIWQFVPVPLINTSHWGT